MPNEWLAWPWLIPAIAAGGLAALALLAAVLRTPVYKHIVCLKYLFCGWKAVVPMVTALPAAIGVFLLILVFAIMNGFAYDTREMTRGTLADIIVDAHMEGLPYYDEFARRIENVEGVQAATPIIQTYAVIRVKPRYTGIRPIVRPCVVLGIRPAEKAKMGRFQEYLGRERLIKQIQNQTDAVLEALRASPGSASTREVQTYLILDILEDIDKAREAGLCSFEECALAVQPTVKCLELLRKGASPPGDAIREAARGLHSLRDSLKQRRVAPEEVLTVQAGRRGDRRPGAKEPSGCIGGIGVIGTPMPHAVSEIVQAGAGWRVLLVVVAALALVVFLFVWQAGRRHRGRRLWRLATWAWAGAVLALALEATFIPVVPSRTERQEVIDFPLVDYGGDLVVSTIPVRASGALDVEAGGIPKVSSRVLTLVDTFKSGYWEADSTNVYVDFATAQQMAGMDAQPSSDGRAAAPARASQIQVKVKDPARAAETVRGIEEAWQTFVRERPEVGPLHLTVNTWETQQRMILTVVEVEKYITALMLGAMFVGFGVLIGLISYVMAYIKSRDVGILKALGAHDAGVGSLFLGYGFIIGAIGTALGLSSALLMLHYLDAIELWVNSTLHINVFPREMYYFDHIPQHLSAEWCVAVALGVLALSTLASMAGGLLAALKQPVEALRYE